MSNTTSTRGIRPPGRDRDASGEARDAVHGGAPGGAEGSTRGPGRTAVPMLCGLAAAAAAVGVGEAVAAFGRPAAAPVLAIGSTAIDLAPTAVKEWAVRSFGTADKTVLLSGILTVLAVLAAALGPVAARRRALGILLPVGFGALGVWAALARPDAGPADVLPSSAAALAGAAVLLALLRRRPAPPVRSVPQARAGDGQGRAGDGGDAADDGRTDGRGGERGGEGTGTAREGSGAEQDSEPDPDQDTDRERADGHGPDRARDTATAAGPDPAPPARRTVLAAGAVIAVSAGLATGGRTLSDRRNDVTTARRAVRLPAPARPAPPLPAGADLRLPGMPGFRTGTADFYRVDTALALPRIDPRDWALRIHGLVDRPLLLDFDDLLALPLDEFDHTLSCVSNEVGGPYVGTTRWLGASLPGLLRRAGVRAGADQLLGTSKDGMTIGTPLDPVLDGRTALLAVAMDGEPLPVEHGFPCRTVVPGFYGYASATKWLVDLEVTTFAAHDPYWVRRGWDRTGEVRTASRIDVPAAFARVPAGDVTVAGTAWATHRGVAAVEVRVDGGPWRQASLAVDAGPDVWRQWSLRWTGAAPGTHRLEVRATDAAGAVQDEARRPPYPSGATGWHSTVVTVV
ncbi:molybdopterin-dependent oxidoreductase [Streptomyces sp. BE303]|uniref:molybdopterin-dependent oxidoreductase n=1 Tax=Streptomyces sp. BE303 TaxID=3002528 RepID=UPI002E78AB24|nr:molybdopterin-dependent oxidoreductase [Streptomyces sp. BE303]MED7955207.1 molybdopterin-dependent oxidoreductase [Streptomyces sp. BE303]